MIVAGVDLDKKYTMEEVLEMAKSGRYKGIVLKGYVCQANDDGLVGFVPWTESSLFRSEHGRTVREDFSAEAEQMRVDVEREHPITRSTALTKRDRIWLRLLRAYNRDGFIPDDVMTTALGDSWSAGDPINAELLKTVAAHFAALGESANKEADAHRSTRAHMTA